MYNEGIEGKKEKWLNLLSVLVSSSSIKPIKEKQRLNETHKFSYIFYVLIYILWSQNILLYLLLTILVTNN